MLAYKQSQLEAGARLVKLALSQTRGHSPEKPDAELSESILLLLRLANHDADLVVWASQLTGASADELHTSVIAFIERHFFRTGNNHYAVLGLNPWATLDDVKEHYRLLIRLFHPDRGLVNSVNAAIYAAMINQAYAAIKDTLAVEPTQTAKSRRLANVNVFKSRAQAEGSAAARRQRLWALCVGITPAKMLLATLLLAMLLVWLVVPKVPSQISKQDVLSVIHGHPLPGSLQQSAPADKAAKLEANVDVDKRVVSEAAALVLEEEAKRISNELAGLEILPNFVDVVPSKSVSKAELAPTIPDLSITDKTVKKALVQSLPQANVGAKVAKSIAATREKEQASALDEQVAVMSISPVATVKPELTETVPDKADVAAKIKVELPSERELRNLLLSFIDSYERGDIKAFMQLFAENVDSDEDEGRVGIQKAYTRFFANSQNRSIVLKDVNWKREPELVVGDVDYRASSVRLGQTESQLGQGALRFEVVKSNSKVNIVGFYHVAH